MRKLSMSVIILIVIASAAAAHEGSIGLYTSTDHNDCDYSIMTFVPYDITIMYYRSDGGPDGITGAEFKVAGGTPGSTSFEFTPSPEVATTTGSITTALAVAFSQCQGSSADYVFIGTVTFTNLDFAATSITLQVLQSDGLNKPPYAPRVSDCGDLQNREIWGVLGGYFTSPNGTCNLATKESSWGAIKELYRQ